MNVLVAEDGPVRIITIDRPGHRNAVDGPTAAALADAFREFDADESAAVAVLTGAGGHFCAGADLKAIGTDRGNRIDTDMASDGPMGPTRMVLSKPVIAAVEGYAVAGGLELAIWADLRVAAEDSTFGVYCRRWGVPLIDGGTVRLPRLIGAGRARDLILTGRSVDAAEAAHIGLVDRVTASGQALTTAIMLAHQISALPQTCMRNDRLAAIEGEGRSETEALEREFELGLESLQSGALDGAARFTDGAGRHGQRV